MTISHLGNSGIIPVDSRNYSTMIMYCNQCLLAFFELLFIATVFIFSRIYFLVLLTANVISMKLKNNFYRHPFCLSNSGLPDGNDFEGWREVRVRTLEKIDTSKLLALDKEIRVLLKTREVSDLISRSSTEDSYDDSDGRLEALRNQLQDMLGNLAGNGKEEMKFAHPSVNSSIKSELSDIGIY